MPDAEIIRLLDECGFREGIRKSSVDVNEVQNEALAKCHELSFLSVNIHGMVADVVVHERITSPRALDENEPYNLVADCDGVVVSSLVLNGQTLFNTGDTVFKGQLLVSGLVDSTSGKTLLRRAKGKVFPRTNRTLTFEVPLESLERVYTKVEVTKGVRILGKSFYKKPKSETGDYEVLLEEREIKLCGLSLPVTEEIRTTSYYIEEKALVSPEEAERRARDEYAKYISTELDGASIIKEDFSLSKSEASVILTVSVEAIENIATEKKILITE